LNSLPELKSCLACGTIHASGDFPKTVAKNSMLMCD
jgi:hypothetical protein